MVAVAVIGGIVSLVCWIMVLIEMFKDSVVQGIIGLICGLWAFVWGWTHKSEGSLSLVMPVWTIAIIAGIVANVMSAHAH